MNEVWYHVSEPANDETYLPGKIIQALHINIDVQLYEPWTLEFSSQAVCQSKNKKCVTLQIYMLNQHAVTSLTIRKHAETLTEYQQQSIEKQSMHIKG